MIVLKIYIYVVQNKNICFYRLLIINEKEQFLYFAQEIGFVGNVCVFTCLVLVIVEEVELIYALIYFISFVLFLQVFCIVLIINVQRDKE